MLLASETSIQLTNALEKLIDSGIQLGERVLGALIIFIIGKFLVNWLNRLFARILEKRKVDPSIQSFLKSMVNILLLIMLILAVMREIRYRTDRIRRTSRFCRCCHRYGTVW